MQEDSCERIANFVRDTSRKAPEPGKMSGPLGGLFQAVAYLCGAPAFSQLVMQSGLGLPSLTQHQGVGASLGFPEAILGNRIVLEITPVDGALFRHIVHEENGPGRLRHTAPCGCGHLGDCQGSADAGHVWSLAVSSR